MTFMAVLGQIGKVLGPVGIVSVMFLCYIMARLSARLGAVTTMPPVYRWFYVSIGLFSISLLTELLKMTAPSRDVQAYSWLFSDTFNALAYNVPLALGATIGLAVSWKYWGWLLTGRDM